MLLSSLFGSCGVTLHETTRAICGSLVVVKTDDCTCLPSRDGVWTMRSIDQSLEIQGASNDGGQIHGSESSVEAWRTLSVTTLRTCCGSWACGSENGVVVVVVGVVEVVVFDGCTWALILIRRRLGAKLVDDGGCVTAEPFTGVVEAGSVVLGEVSIDGSDYRSRRESFVVLLYAWALVEDPREELCSLGNLKWKYEVYPSDGHDGGSFTIFFA
ncbi:hypothetical protein DVH24_019365 [Malus domestica]|uniref:Uncharacterized protein n=1 Tax=Malus domestica TaxID=3750 RepID=A0A498I3H6_MALDO|nr:hypothetical protein DVH24_019365 [Malus domestica]